MEPKLEDTQPLPPINWEFEFRVVTPDGQALTHKSYSAFESMDTPRLWKHVNRVVDEVFNELVAKGYITL